MSRKSGEALELGVQEQAESEHVNVMGNSGRNHRGPGGTTDPRIGDRSTLHPGGGRHYVTP